MEIITVGFSWALAPLNMQGKIVPLCSSPCVHYNAYVLQGFLAFSTYLLLSGCYHLLSGETAIPGVSQVVYSSGASGGGQSEPVRATSGGPSVGVRSSTADIAFGRGFLAAKCICSSFSRVQTELAGVSAGISLIANGPSGISSASRAVCRLTGISCIFLFEGESNWKGVSLPFAPPLPRPMVRAKHCQGTHTLGGDKGLGSTPHPLSWYLSPGAQTPRTHTFVSYGHERDAGGYFYDVIAGARCLRTRRRAAMLRARSNRALASRPPAEGAGRRAPHTPPYILCAHHSPRPPILRGGRGKSVRTTPGGPFSIVFLLVFIHIALYTFSNIFVRVYPPSHMPTLCSAFSLPGSLRFPEPWPREGHRFTTLRPRDSGCLRPHDELPDRVSR